MSPFMPSVLHSSVDDIDEEHEIEFTDAIDGGEPKIDLNVGDD